MFTFFVLHYSLISSCLSAILVYVNTIQMSHATTHLGKMIGYCLPKGSRHQKDQILFLLPMPMATYIYESISSAAGFNI